MSGRKSLTQVRADVCKEREGLEGFAESDGFELHNKINNNQTTENWNLEFRW